MCTQYKTQRPQPEVNTNSRLELWKESFTRNHWEIIKRVIPPKKECITKEYEKNVVSLTSDFIRNIDETTETFPHANLNISPSNERIKKSINEIMHRISKRTGKTTDGIKYKIWGIIMETKPYLIMEILSSEINFYITWTNF